MKQHKKNKLMTFLFSLIPGAAEMYMGFMKMGVRLMSLFAVCIIIPVTLRINDVFMLVVAVFWAYGFFHARNLAAMEEESFMLLEDTYVWDGFLKEQNVQITNPAIRKWGAVCFIVAGVVLLWNSLTDMLYWVIPNYLWNELSPIVDRLPQVFIAVVIIIAGMRLIAGKKEELHGEE